MPSDGACTGWACLPLAGWQALRPQDPVLQLAVAIALALAVLTLLLMLQVMVLAELASRRERRRSAFDARWRPLLALRSLGQAGDAPLPRLPRGQRLWFLLLWIRTQRQLRGQALANLNALLRELGLERHALRLLRSRSVRKRLLGLGCLRHLGDSAYWNAVAPLVLARNPAVSLSAAQTLVAMHPTRAMQTLLPLALHRPDWAQPRLAALCRQAGPAAVTGPLLGTLLDTAEPGRERLVDLLVWADPRHTAAWARQTLEDETAHAPVALECLGELADPRDHARLLRTLEQPDPEVRLAALRALRRQLRADDETALRACLADASWWVRQEAADALVRLPGLPAERLPALLESIADRYGRDALRRALAEQHG